MRLARNPQAGIAGFIQPSSPDAWCVATIGAVARASTEMHVTGRHRLVEVEHVEALLLEHALDPEDGARAEDDVRQRAVRGHDHRAPDRDHVRRRVAVAADPGVEGARELTRRVVTHHQPYLVPTRLERLGLELGVLDDGAPE